jgi:hypothetical protein
MRRFIPTDPADPATFRYANLSRTVIETSESFKIGHKQILVIVKLR